MIEASGGSSSRPVKINMEDRVASSKTRLAAIQHIKRKVAIVRMWPDQAVAEHENVERFRIAFQFIGVDLVEIDRYGAIISSPNQKITSQDVDFVIHLHFETGKTYDVTSVAAMWNPPHFYYDWGFDRFWANQMSHDVFACTGAEEVIGMLRVSQSLGLENIVSLLNHSLSDPIYEPTRKVAYKSFYCGINWEKISGKKGRHDAVLKSLDAMDLVDIYGPTSLQGKLVWDGHKGYRGPLPFDGQTIISKIAEAGTCLVFSSEAHIESDVMSNRLFEGLAAGAVIIGDEHPFISHAIGENYVRIPSWMSAEQRADAIASALSGFNADPEKALAMARAAQAHFVEKFFLTDQLVNLYETTERFKTGQQQRLSEISTPVVDLVIQPLVQDAVLITERIEHLRTKFNDRAHITIIASSHQIEWYQKQFGRFATVVGNDKEKTILHPYECMRLAGSHLKCEKVMFLLGIEEMFPDSVLSACLELRGQKIGRLGHVLKHMDTNGDFHFDFRSGAVGLDAHTDASLGSIVFDVSWLKSKIPFFALTWKDLCRIAEIEDEGIVELLKTTSIINLHEYQIVHSKGYKWSNSALDVTQLVGLATAVKAPLNGGAVLRRLPAKSKEYSNITGEVIVSEVASLSEERKWALTLSLYKSVPSPKWVKHLITFIRKTLGVR